MTDIDLRRATLNDVAALAEMNRQLILDEGSKNNMTLAELAERMRAWLTANREAVVVERAGEMIGYLLYREHQESYYPSQASIYVRQFFIQPSYRRRGIGQSVFEQIVAEFFPKGSAIMLDVLESNSEGKAFWLKLGFSIYHTTLRRESD
ncbi:MAG: GNAT family N-acetyltransferase [Anaerolineae bacterium]|nr:GNAT family N-acetyltransferase [Anaerolineae bacterium]MDQ7035976.1 GNAT family N-acetyltransferase [Anaerolineae bacterium]